MRARSSGLTDGIDDLYITSQYEALVNSKARSKQADLEYKLTTFYGHLQHLFAVYLLQYPQIGLEHPTTVLLA